jgi:hypothetical protein
MTDDITRANAWSEIQNAFLTCTYYVSISGWEREEPTEKNQ